MKSSFFRIICILLYLNTVLGSTPFKVTEAIWNSKSESTEVDDDGKVYKNPRNSPSTECPRDEEQATILGQKCLRKCASDEDCKSKKKKCICDGVCGMSCIKPDRECADLTQPLIGQVHIEGRYFGARATYFCPNGHHVVGLQSRLCQADGNWAGVEPACKKNIYCLSPPQIDHARHSALPEQSTFDLDSTIQYHCHTGYVTNGFPRSKCLAIDGQASWYGPDIQCEPRSCGQPPDPAYGWHTGECYTYGCRIIYNCGDGYELVGRQDRHCQTDGSWTPKELPTCVSFCMLPKVLNGRYFEEHISRSAGNNSSSFISTGSRKNDSIILKCNEGFNIQGPSHFKCINGTWSIQIFPECAPQSCILPKERGITYKGGYRSGLTIAHGSSVMYRCATNFKGKTHKMHCSYGNISREFKNCEQEELQEFLNEAEFLSKELDSNLPGSYSDKETLNNIERFKNNNSASIQDLAKEKFCGHPSKVEGALIYRNIGEEFEEGYISGTEIYFNCIASVAGERSTWKIICDDGQWIGRSYTCANGTCFYRKLENNVVSFYNDLEIREDVVEFPAGASIVSRCVDIGKYAISGSNERTCVHSEWTGTKTFCSGLNQENDYAMEKAPTILFRHENGPIAQSNDGKLIVFPGTTLNMECLWMRRFGNPKWNVSHDFRNYPEGWVTDADEGRDAQLEYRLSIINAVVEDSGIFTCQTPARHEHSVEIVVKAIYCPEIPIRRGLLASTNDTKLSSNVMLSCVNGNSLIGSSELICMSSGNWSAPLPICESVECGDIPLMNNQSAPSVSVLSREVGGRASFSCASGYGLLGPSETTCLYSGEWALPIPICVEVQCDAPGNPPNGYAQGSFPYRAGDVVQFNCNPEFMMHGQPIIACQDNGRWSGGLPICVQACSYPGTVISGRMSSVKFYYVIGESITFTCDAGLEIRGAKMLKCLKNGKWSNAIPTCMHQDKSHYST